MIALKLLSLGFLKNQAEPKHILDVLIFHSHIVDTRSAWLHRASSPAARYLFVFLRFLSFARPKVFMRKYSGLQADANLFRNCLYFFHGFFVRSIN